MKKCLCFNARSDNNAAVDLFKLSSIIAFCHARSESISAEALRM
jgi:hypothetical protein